MKKFSIFCLLWGFSFLAASQTVYNYFLVPGPDIQLTVNESVTFKIGETDANGDPVPQNNMHIGNYENPRWFVNGHAANVQLNDGVLTPQLNFLTATYTAPAAAPGRNPVAIAVSFHINDTSKQVVTLVCNVKIIDAQYKVNLEAEITGPEGLHYLLSGTSYTNLVSFADGTYSLVPVDGTNNMQITIHAASEPNMKLVEPKNWQYSIPFVLNIGDINKSNEGNTNANISFGTFSPTKNAVPYEKYSTPAGVIPFPGRINNYFSAAFYNMLHATSQDDHGQLEFQLEWANRLQAHQNDPAYFQTAQGKADLLQQQKYMQEHGIGKMYTGNGQAPANATAYSKAFVKGMQQTQTNTPAFTKQGSSAPAVMRGSLHLTGSFNSASKTAMTLTEEASAGDEDNALSGTIKILVEKLH